MADERWSIVVHGGAKEIDPALQARNRSGCRAAAEAGAAVLRAGGNAVDAAEAALSVLENDPTFNAGFGSVRNADGDVEMDAAMMDGGDLAVGAVAGVRRLRNPIAVARALLPEVPVLLAGEGAERFAQAHGFVLCRPEEMISNDGLVSEKAHDTVGCVARDARGSIAAATSTGGLPGKAPGRIGDSPVPGAGLYADNMVGGVAFSGDGEAILRTALAAHVMHVLETAPAGAAARSAIQRLARVGGEAGAILIDRAGRIAIAHNSMHFATGIAASWIDDAQGTVHRDEWRDLVDG